MEWLKPPFLLRELKIELTHDCALQCVHCSSNARANSAMRMEWPVFAQILDDAASMGVQKVAFSGGEPLLWRHISNAVERAKNHGRRLFYTQAVMLHIPVISASRSD